MLRRLACVTLGFFLSGLLSAAPVEFRFRVVPAGADPFAREIWAEVTAPDDSPRLLPAFFAGGDLWAVRTRADRVGTYRLGEITETIGDTVVPCTTAAASPPEVSVSASDPLGGPIRIDPRSPRRFVQGDGTPFYPLGVNLPWPHDESDPAAYYAEVFARAARIGLNWTRVWMAHWSGLNLDWRAIEHGPSPAPGTLALDVADRWDLVLSAAEQAGLRVQVVLQHHGQYSSAVNSNWDINPWNAANGGFLATPAEFFTSARARELTRRKLRYIVARWGHSPAIFAWELFNEVKWTDARAGGAGTNAAVAAWHAEMARYIRSLDTERHLVTTSDDNLRHPLYDAMDFLQPHLYARNLLAGVRRFDVDPSGLDRPIFYGEVGDDNLPGLSPAVLASGAANLPLAWASLMGAGPHAAQLWYAYRLMLHDRFDELESLVRFARASGLDRPADDTAFSPAVVSADRMPLTLEPGMHWHRTAPPVVHVPADGSVPAELAEIPAAVVWRDDPHGGIEPFPHAVTLHLDYPRDATAVLRMNDAHPDGASIRVTLDGVVVHEHVWPRVPDNRRDPPVPRPLEFILPMKPGRRTLLLENPQGPKWAGIGSLATGLDVPQLAAAGRRAADRIVLWIYHRVGVFSERPPPPARATIQLADVPAGRWRVTWWDVATGQPAESSDVDHAGGRFALETPPVSRHTAVWLERRSDADSD